MDNSGIADSRTCQPDSYRFRFFGETFVYEPETMAIRRADAGPIAFDNPTGEGDLAPETLRPVRAISLAVSQACNMACSYCYAEKGGFGGRPRVMDKAVAFGAIQRLIESTPRGGKVNIAFMGGEPLLNQKLIHEATEYAVGRGLGRGVTPEFSLTTNAVRINSADIELFRRHRFSVTVSIDGTEEQQNSQRPLASGTPSYQKVVAAIRPLLRYQRDMYVGARATVRCDNIDLPGALSNLRQLGFRDIGFSPLLNSPSGEGELRSDDLSVYLEQLKECGDDALARLVNGKHVDFSNLTTALREIHASRPKYHPCGAGNGYVGVGADSELYYCHRYINDPKGHIGSVHAGVDVTKQEALVHAGNVNRQPQCSQCWARHLCGGGCYHEVEDRGRPACDMIRGWMDYCLKAWLFVRVASPTYLKSDQARNEITV